METGYPDASTVSVQKNYTMFMNLCGKCHTTARPLNAPIVTRAQWNRFVHRMHFKAQSRLLTKVSAKAIVTPAARDLASGTPVLALDERPS